MTHRPKGGGSLNTTHVIGGCCLAVAASSMLLAVGCGGSDKGGSKASDAGSSLAGIVVAQRRESSDKPPSLVRLNPDGSDERSLSPPGMPASEPAVSPDGRKLAFIGSTNGESDVYVMDADGGEVQNLSNSSALEEAPAWSPDGEKISYAQEGSMGFDLYVIGADGTDPHVLREAPGDQTAPAWSPDGRQISFTNAPGVRNPDSLDFWVMNADGSNARDVATGDNGASIGAGGSLVPESMPWSPDGKYFVMGDGGQLFTMSTRDTNGKTIKAITAGGSSDVTPVWSPDGEQILFSSNRGPNGPRLYLIGLHGGNPSEIRTEGGRRCCPEYTHPSWVGP